MKSRFALVSSFVLALCLADSASAWSWPFGGQKANNNASSRNTNNRNSNTGSNSSSNNNSSSNRNSTSGGSSSSGSNTSGGGSNNSSTSTSSSNSSSASNSGSTSSNTGSTPMPTGVAGNWTLMFDDEFDGASLDTTKWSTCWFSPSCGKQNNVSTSPANVSVSGGYLILTLATPNSGASVSTNPKGGATTGYQFKTGVVEARIFFPGDSKGCYNWSAWWTNGQSWPADGENDIAEVLNGQITTNYHSSSGAHNLGAMAGAQCAQWHIYTLNRQVGHSYVYLDGALVKSYATDDTGNPHYLILNVGNSSSHTMTGSTGAVKVDWVRAWQ